MCGIAAILRFSPASSAPPAFRAEWLELLDGAIRHRGGDGEGRFTTTARHPSGLDASVVLLHRRLAILDLPGGGQPMTAPGGQDTISFNGCIYNHAELRRELIGAGVVFRSDHSDTEVLLEGWKLWGEALLPRLDGMYAAVLWDSRRRTLITLTDRFGEKPLYVAGSPANGVWVLSSSAVGVHHAARAAGVTGGALSGERTLRWLVYGGEIDPPFEGVARVPPGVHELSPDMGLRRLAGFAPTPVRSEWDAQDPKLEVGRRLDAAVAARLNADVPLAALLSGGVDSSLIAAAAQRHGDLATICVRMPDSRYDESPAASRTARALGTSHHTVEAQPDALADLARLISTLGLPLGDSSILPTYWACVGARPLAKVLLGGDGGDELFLGYERYAAARALHAARESPVLRAAAGRMPLVGHPKSLASKLGRWCQAVAGRGYEDLVAVFPSWSAQRLFPEWVNVVGNEPPADPASAAAARDWELPGHFRSVLLRKIDHASMLAQVEFRAPFLAGPLADAALALPGSILTPRGRPKALLRSLVRTTIPGEGGAIARRRKSGFAIPLSDWFRRDFGGLGSAVADLLGSADPFPGVPVAIDLAAARRLRTEHLSGEFDHSQRLFSLLVLGLWSRSLATPDGIRA